MTKHEFSLICGSLNDQNHVFRALTGQKSFFENVWALYIFLFSFRPNSKADHCEIDESSDDDEEDEDTVYECPGLAAVST